MYSNKWHQRYLKIRFVSKDENAGRNNPENPRAIFMGKDDFVNIIVSVIYYILNGVSYVLCIYTHRRHCIFDCVRLCIIFGEYIPIFFGGERI